jgi:integrase
MINAQHSRKPAPPVPLASTKETMAQVLTRMAADPEVTWRRAGEIRSGVTTLCRVLGTTPDTVPADPAYFAERASRLTPGLTHLSAGRLRNCRSLVEATLDYAGRIAIRRRSSENMGDEFTILCEAADDRTIRPRLGRFFRYATAHDLTPGDVTTELFEAFLAQLTVSGNIKAKQIDRDARNAWNKAVATVEGWPNVIVAVPCYTDHYVLPPEAFPPSFSVDIEAYVEKRRFNPKSNPLNLLDDEDLFSGPTKANGRKKTGPVCGSTADLIGYQFRQFASILVNAGFLPVEKVHGLAAIVPPPLVKQGLGVLLARVSNPRNSQIFGIATNIAIAARHWVKLPDDDCARLNFFVSKVRPKHDGLPECARRALAHFRDPETVRQFLNLASQVFAELAKIKNPTWMDANTAAAALWIALAQRIPLRISNLVGIDLEKNILKAHNGKNAPRALYFTADEVKNDKAIEAPLSPQLIVLLDTFVSRYRKLLVDVPTNALFPTPSGASKRPSGMSAAIQKLMLRRLGFAINPHSFRHVAAMLFLSVNPGAYVQVQLLLGHRRLETTIKYYCDLRAEDAFIHFDQALLKLAKDSSHAH